MRALLDINVLIALFDSQHQFHSIARAWLEQNITQGWASCPITQNGVLRILSQPSYPNAVSLTDAYARLRDATDTVRHEFWPDDISLLNPAIISPGRIASPKQITDTYLLALATYHGGRLATFDRGIKLTSVATATHDNLIYI